MYEKLADLAYWIADRANKRARFWIRVGRWFERKAVDRRIPSRTNPPF